MTLKLNRGGDVITNPHSTNKCTFLLLRISLQITSYTFQLNCHHQRADTILL